jgi:hypothetical protein
MAQEGWQSAQIRRELVGRRNRNDDGRERVAPGLLRGLRAQGQIGTQRGAQLPQAVPAPEVRRVREEHHYLRAQECIGDALGKRLPRFDISEIEEAALLAQQRPECFGARTAATSGVGDKNWGAHR